MKRLVLTSQKAGNHLTRELNHVICLDADIYKLFINVIKKKCLQPHREVYHRQNQNP